MFKKTKQCPKCDRKIEKNHNFCPFCGKNLKSQYDREDYGFLGKDDFIDQENPFNLNSSIIDKMLNNAMKAIEKQMRNLPNELNKDQDKGPEQMPHMRVRFLVNGREISPKKIQEKPIKPIRTELSKEKADKFAKLPKKEPKSKMKRLSNRIIYELSVPGVKDIEDILINQLENSIEIKALSKSKVYSKTLNINLPIIRYSLIKGNLILELQVK